MSQRAFENNVGSSCFYKFNKLGDSHPTNKISGKPIKISSDSITIFDFNFLLIFQQPNIPINARYQKNNNIKMLDVTKMSSQLDLMQCEYQRTIGSLTQTKSP